MIKFNNSEEELDLICKKLSNGSSVLVYSEDKSVEVPLNESGFVFHNNDHEYNFSDYNIILKKNEDGSVEFSNDKRTYYISFFTNSFGFVTNMVKSINKGLYVFAEGNIAEISNKEVELSDMDGFFKYIIDNNTIREVSDDDKNRYNEMKLEKAKEIKKNEFKNICSESIVKGIDYNDEHYSYSLADQNNLYNLVQMSLATGLDVPYHSDGSSCRLFTKVEISNIYKLAETNVTSNVTYNNQMKKYIDSLSDIEIVENLKYGDELTGQYLEEYNSIMTQSEIIIKTFLKED